MLSGELIAGRYEIEQLSTTGGMAVVYRARDVVRDRPVALKVVHRDDQAVDRERFQRDAERLAGLGHPSIAIYLDHGVTPLGESYVVQPWIDAPTLASRLRTAALGVRDAVEITRAVAEALAAAHAAGVLHRGIDATTIFVGDPIQVVDFGLALIASGPARKLTRTGVAVGSVGYTAPQLLRAGAEADAPADVFALGVVLYECLARREAFRGATALAKRARIVAYDPPPLAGAPPGLAELVARLIAKSPADRFADAGAVVAAMQALDGLPATALADPGVPDGGSAFIIVAAAATSLEGRDRSTLQDELDALVGEVDATAFVMDDGSAVIASPAFATSAEAAMRVVRRLHAAWPNVPIAIGTEASIDSLAKALDNATLEIAFAPDPPRAAGRILVGPEVDLPVSELHELRIRTK